MAKTQLEKTQAALNVLDTAMKDLLWHIREGHGARSVKNSETQCKSARTYLNNQIEKLDVDNTVGKKVS